jgi:hypothetical protein
MVICSACMAGPGGLWWSWVVRACLAWVVAKVMLMLRCRRVQATSGRVLWTARGDDMMGWSASTPQQMSSVGGV